MVDKQDEQAQREAREAKEAADQQEQDIHKLSGTPSNDRDNTGPDTPETGNKTPDKKSNRQ